MTNISEITEKAYAKINLWLEVTDKRPDGYHDLVSVMQSISLHDTVIIVLSDSKTIEINCSDPTVPSDARNIAYKAAELFYKKLGKACEGTRITIEKRIPSEAGLGGGSADAASVLRGLNRLYGCPFDTDTLRKISVSLGADVPFCISGGTMLAEGIGEILTPLQTITKENGIFFTVCRGNDRMSTPKAFGELDSISYTNKDPAAILNAIESGEAEAIAKGLFNRFETVVPPDKEISDLLLQNGALNVLLSGSGTALYGIFNSLETAEKACEKVKDIGVFACTACAEAPSI